MEGNHHLKAVGFVTGSSLPQKEPRTWSWTWGPEQTEGAHSKASQHLDLSAYLAFQEDGRLWFLDLGVLLTLGRAQAHSNLFLCWEQGFQPNCRHPAGKTQKSQLPREDIGSRIPSLLLWIPKREQLAVGFSYQEKLHTE